MNSDPPYTPTQSAGRAKAEGTGLLTLPGSMGTVGPTGQSARGPQGLGCHWGTRNPDSEPTLHLLVAAALGALGRKSLWCERFSEFLPGFPREVTLHRFTRKCI